MKSLDHLVPRDNRLARLASAQSDARHATRLLYNAYHAGFQGCFLDRLESPVWARECAKIDRDEMPTMPTVADGMPSDLVGTGKGRRACNWIYTVQIMPTAYRGSQAFGNCRAWSARCATVTLLGMAVAGGAVHRSEYRHGTAFVYGYRGSRGQGMSMSRGVEVLTTLGQSEEKDYGFVDLSTQR